MSAPGRFPFVYRDAAGRPLRNHASKGSEIPHALTAPEMKILAVKFSEATRRAVAAGFRRGGTARAHGFLLCQFLSPYTNRRTDKIRRQFRQSPAISRGGHPGGEIEIGQEHAVVLPFRRGRYAAKAA